MNTDDWLKQASTQLTQAGIGTARLDALVLLEDVTGHNRAWLLARPDHELSSAEQAKLKKLLNERARHTPLAYLRGYTEFYGRNFVITSAVLEPRPESETMIDLLLELQRTNKLPSKNLRIADVGAGSGALGITAWLEFPNDLKPAVDLLEIDPKAMSVAKVNVDKYTTSINVIESDLLSGSSKDYHVLLCNLPYVPDSYTVNEAALQEPRLAIFGGPDGLDIYRQLFHQIPKLTKQPLYILCESLPPHHEHLASIAKDCGYRLTRSEDFIQLFGSE